MKVAVIGSGMAAVGVLDALSEWAPNAAVTLVDHGTAIQGRFEAAVAASAWTPELNAEFYGYLRREHGYKFPPPKTHFGTALPRQHVDGWGDIWQSRALGGLTNFWGASVVPFTKRDMAHWPGAAAALRNYYRRAADRIGVSGRPDALSRYFEDEHLTRPPIALPPVMEKLERALQRSATNDRVRLFAGIGRLAIETRPDNAACCTFDGECMVGCRVGAIYNAKRDIDRFKNTGLIVDTVNSRVLSIGRNRHILLEGGGQIGPFDRIHLCAGCAGTTEIVMRSLYLREGPVMTDNAVFSFPIVHAGGGGPVQTNRIFGLTNLIVAGEPVDPAARSVMIQVYPAFDHLWRYYLPVRLWKSFAPAARFLRRRLMLGRLYLHGDHSQAYSANISADGGFGWRLQRQPPKLSDVGEVWPAVRRAFNQGGFVVPPFAPIRHKTSSHYAASLPLGSEAVATSGEIFPGVVVCDSATFTDAPAASPSLTIFAQACRLAHESL